jgi:hypothetical protein
LDCLWIGEKEAASYLALWTVLQMAVRAVNVSRAASLEMLEAVYAMFQARFNALRKIGRGKAFGMGMSGLAAASCCRSRRGRGSARNGPRRRAALRN